jgi:hypothetical protein
LTFLDAGTHLISRTAFAVAACVLSTALAVANNGAEATITTACAVETLFFGVATNVVTWVRGAATNLLLQTTACVNWDGVSIKILFPKAVVTALATTLWLADAVQTAPRETEGAAGAAMAGVTRQRVTNPVIVAFFPPRFAATTLVATFAAGAAIAILLAMGTGLAASGARGCATERQPAADGREQRMKYGAP